MTEAETNAIYRTIRDVLSSLYPQRADIERVANDAGIDVRRIPVAGNALGLWDAVIIEAHNIGHLGVLLDVAVSEYSSNIELRTVYADYWRDKAKRVSRETGIPLGLIHVHDNIPANAHIAQAIHQLRNEFQAYILRQRPHKLRGAVVVSLFVCLPVYTGLVMGGVRDWLGLSTGLAWVLATGVAYMPPILHVFTLPTWFNAVALASLLAIIFWGWG